LVPQVKSTNNFIILLHNFIPSQFLVIGFRQKILSLIIFSVILLKTQFQYQGDTKCIIKYRFMILPLDQGL